MAFQGLRRLGVSRLRTFATGSSAPWSSAEVGTTLRSLVLLEHDIAQTCAFFREGLGARVTVATEGWAEVEIGGGGGDDARHVGKGDGGTSEAGESVRGVAPSLKLHLKKRRGPGPDASGATGSDTAGASTVWAPMTTMVVFHVKDVQECIVRMLEHGGQMDGRIEYSPDGTTQAVVRSPGGTMLGLVSDT